eukprot:TRINITY_DN59_c0_g1_i1.p1 TRINITY_DN59_c0_g1~~TRINITY_DN59_c0_g1_i1.p1  ORF type:complete len:101 (+),score=35.53 TRINITY_DN59_c0_g1_i1:215-517(+)
MDSLKSMWNKTTEMAGSAADATSRAAKRKKLEAEIAYNEREIRLLKEKFGVDVYGAIVSQDENTVKAVLAETKPQIDELLAKIAEKREAHATLQSEEAKE